MSIDLRTIEIGQIVVSGQVVDIVRKPIKNLGSVVI